MIHVMIYCQFRVSMIYLLAFLVIFLPLRYGKRKTGLILLGCFVITGLMDYEYLIVKQNEVFPTAVTLAEIVVVQITPFLISKYRDFRTMFVGFTASAYVLAGNIVSSVLYLAGAGLVLNMVCQCMMHTFLLGILVWKIRESFLDSLENTELQWAKLCVIPAMFYAAVYAISMWPANIYKQPANLLGVCCIQALMVISYIMLFQMFARQRQDHELKRSMEYLENYASRLKQEADTIHEKEIEAAVVRHDLRHYSILINSYLEEEKTEEIRELLKELNEHVLEMKSVRYCENLAVNGIIAYCAKQAKKQGVRFKADTEIPQKMKVNEFEFATVVSNLLENALNAASQAREETLRFVEISAQGVKGQLLLHIRNGCVEKPEISDRTGLPISQKGERHGYGMQSVQAFLKKNDALFDFSSKDKIFSVKILVNI